MSSTEPHAGDEKDVRQELPVFRSEGIRTQLMAIYDEALSRWPVPFETFFVPTRYGNTHVIASGDPASSPLVMLHPAAVGGFVWSSIIAPLSDRHRVYALDTIGDVGKSELMDPDRYPKTGREYTAWLDDVHERLNITRADVVAGSMGGWIAMSHAIYAPYRVRRLVLLGPMGLPAWRTTLAVLVPFAWYRRAANERPSLTASSFRSLGEGARVNREFRPWMKIMGQTKPLGGQPIHIPARKLRMIKSRTLVILGGKDGLVGSATAAAKRARNIPGCEIEILPNAGHIMSVDEPEFVSGRIVRLLEG